ncbi:MAG TPA: DUF4393 domain-containing protein [Jatrophihabitantaceae bacterium]|jgi:hypothetical protein|nr:DUF4393 domain-containing protein [Jatrophihabitantaceae bacterium]
MSDDERRPPRAVVVPPGLGPSTLGQSDLPLVGVGTQLVRLAAVSSWRAARWSVNAATTGTSVVLRRATSGQPAPAVIQGIASDLRSAAWHALGIPDSTDEHGVPESIAPVNATVADLRSRGEDLMRRSNDVRVIEDTHPAFARILTEITPDEARVLRFIYVDGPQPAIDIRTNRPFGVGSELVSNGLNMIAEHAGCRNVDRIHPYLTNLARLGLLDFSKEAVTNPQRYQLIEAQPKVSEVLHRAGRWPRIVRRSIRLTEFGEEFCRTCLPLMAQHHRVGNERPSPNPPTESG